MTQHANLAAAFEQKESVLIHHHHHKELCLNAPEPADSNGIDGKSKLQPPKERYAAAFSTPQSLPQSTTPNHSVFQLHMIIQHRQALQNQRYLQQQPARNSMRKVHRKRLQSPRNYSNEGTTLAYGTHSYPFVVYESLL